MKNGVTVTKDITKKVLGAVLALPSRNVYVGVPAAKGYRRPEPGEVGEPANNAQIGYWMEFGAPEANIPARPHLLPGIRMARDKIIAYFKVAGNAAMDFDAARMDRALNAAGLVSVSAVRKMIRDGNFIPLAPATLAARRRRGRTGTKPLLDTGNYWQSLTYVVGNQSAKADAKVIGG